MKLSLVAGKTLTFGSKKVEEEATEAEEAPVATETKEEVKEEATEEVAE